MTHDFRPIKDFDKTLFGDGVVLLRYGFLGIVLGNAQPELLKKAANTASIVLAPESPADAVIESMGR